MKEKLTLSEALEQGYTKFIFADDGFQALNDLSQIDDRDFNRKIELVSKEPYHPSGLEAKDILEQIAEQIYCQHADDSGDDTDDVFEKLMKIDLAVIEPFVNAINSELSKMSYYRSSGIELTNTNAL